MLPQWDHHRHLEVRSYYYAQDREHGETISGVFDRDCPTAANTSASACLYIWSLRHQA